MVLPRKHVRTNIPRELHERLRMLQEELKQMGLKASFMDSGRVAAKQLEQQKARIVIMKRRKKNAFEIL